MQLEQFLNSCAYLYLIEDGFQATAELAGIDWQKLPPFDSVKIIQKYHLRRAELSHHETIMEMRDDVRFLEFGFDVANLGRDEHELGIQFRRLYGTHAYLTLGQALIAQPERGRALIEDFTATLPEPSKSFLVGDFGPILFAEFLERAKTQEARVRIDGFSLLSEMIGGFNRKRIIMLMGETGFGKTNLAMNLAIRAALRSKCLYLNMEMSLEDMTKRMAVLVSRQSYAELYRGDIKFETVRDAMSIFGMNLKMTSGSSLSMGTIEALIRREKKDGLDFVFVDYDQKIDLPYMRNEPEWKALQKAIVRLEDLTKELDICVIMLAQVNRDGDISASHRATFAAHTILDFRNDETYGPVIAARKNRHGKKDQAVRVEYSADDSSIREIEVVNLKIQKGGPSGQRRI